MITKRFYIGQTINYIVIISFLFNLLNSKEKEYGGVLSFKSRYFQHYESDNNNTYVTTTLLGDISSTNSEEKIIKKAPNQYPTVISRNNTEEISPRYIVL